MAKKGDIKKYFEEVAKEDENSTPTCLKKEGPFTLYDKLGLNEEGVEISSMVFQYLLLADKIDKIFAVKSSDISSAVLVPLVSNAEVTLAVSGKNRS